MHTRKIIIAAAFIVLIIIACFIRFENKTGIVIYASLYDVAKQINDLNNWKKWNVDLKNNEVPIAGNFSDDQLAIIKPGHSYTLHHINPLAVSLIIKNKNKTDSFLIKASPLTGTSVYIEWSEKSSLLGLTKKSTSTSSIRNDFAMFKAIMENLQLKYGFPIKLVPVKDTLLLTLIATISEKDIVPLLYRQLVTYINANRLPSEKNYFYKTDLDSNKVAVCIPVYKRLHDTGNIKFLELPATGRLVEASYSGALSEKPSIYTAINNFMIDQHLKQVAQPLEQYNIADTMPNPGSNIKLKIYFPVF